MAHSGNQTQLPLGKIVAVALGNALEFYDFITFSYFAVQIGHSFFPANNASTGLLLTLVSFGIGFVTRPLGGIMIGTLGDRVGRKPAMLLSFSLMGIGITVLALTPSYAAIGVAAPIILVTCRLVQGFALGGEVGPVTAFLIEVAPPERRGLYVALQGATQAAASLTAGLVGLALSTFLGPAALDAWGWRLAFLLGAAVVPIGLAIRRSLPETADLSHESAMRSGAPSLPKRIIILGLLLLTAGTISTYVLQYFTVFAQDSLRMPARTAFGATVVIGVCGIAAAPLSGVLSDRIGRKPVLLATLALLLLSTVPAFVLITRFHSAPAVFAGAAFLSLLQANLVTQAIIAVTEMLPAALRSRALATLYAVAIACFGGTTQFAVKFLLDETGNPLVPAWYMTGAVAIGAVAALLIPETAPAKTRRHQVVIT